MIGIQSLTLNAAVHCVFAEFRREEDSSNDVHPYRNSTPGLVPPTPRSKIRYSKYHPRRNSHGNTCTPPHWLTWTSPEDSSNYVHPFCNSTLGLVPPTPRSKIRYSTHRARPYSHGNTCTPPQWLKYRGNNIL